MTLLTLVNSMCGTNHAGVDGSIEKLSSDTSNDPETDLDLEANFDNLLIDAAASLEEGDYELTPLEKVAAAAYLLEGYKSGEVNKETISLATNLIENALKEKSTNE